MSLDTKTLEQRLLYKDSTISLPSVTKCAIKLQSFGKNLQDEKTLEAFIREVLLYKLEVEKAGKTFQSLDRQSEEYDVLEAQIGEKISQAKGEILRLEGDLKQQKAIREHRVECESLAAVVNKHPSRSTLKRKMSSVVEHLEQTRSNIEAAEADIELKHAQLLVVVKAIAELQRSKEDEETVPEEEENEEEEIDETRDSRNNKADRNGESGKAPADGGDGDGEVDGEEGDEVEAEEEAMGMEVGNGGNGENEGNGAKGALK
jgi:chromosome segregation ATPase